MVTFRTDAVAQRVGEVAGLPPESSKPHIAALDGQIDGGASELDILRGVENGFFEEGAERTGLLSALDALLVDFDLEKYQRLANVHRQDPNFGYFKYVLRASCRPYDRSKPKERELASAAEWAMSAYTEGSYRFVGQKDGNHTDALPTKAGSTVYITTEYDRDFSLTATQTRQEDFDREMIAVHETFHAWRNFSRGEKNGWFMQENATPEEMGDFIAKTWKEPSTAPRSGFVEEDRAGQAKYLYANRFGQEDLGCSSKIILGLYQNGTGSLEWNQYIWSTFAGKAPHRKTTIDHHTFARLANAPEMHYSGVAPWHYLTRFLEEIELEFLDAKDMSTRNHAVARLATVNGFYLDNRQRWSSSLAEVETAKALFEERQKGLLDRITNSAWPLISNGNRTPAWYQMLHSQCGVSGP